MAPAPRQFCILVVGGDCILRLHDRCGWFKSDAKHDVFTIRNAALNTTTPVGGGAHTTIYHPERVIVL